MPHGPAQILHQTFTSKAFFQGFPEYSGKVRLTAGGATLYELILCVSCLGLLALMGLPGMRSWIQQAEGERAIHELSRAVNLARYTALEQGAMVTLCRSANGLECGGKWEDGSIVFIDHNANRVIDQEDRLIYHFSSGTQGTVTFRSFQNRQYLQFTPMGFTNHQNGNFTWCPPDRNSKLAQQLVINRAGRARVVMDQDGNGNQGGSLSC